MTKIIMHIIEDNGTDTPLSGREARGAYLEVDLDLLTDDMIVLNAAPDTDHATYPEPTARMRFPVPVDVSRQTLMQIAAANNLDRYLKTLWDGYSPDYEHQDGIVLNQQALAAAKSVAGFIMKKTAAG